METNDKTIERQEGENNPLLQAREIVSQSTQDIVEAFFRRQEAMQLIANAKISETGQDNTDFGDLSVIRLDREFELLEEYQKLAVEKGEDPGILKMLIWYLMYAGKTKQLGILGKGSVYGKESLTEQELINNLLGLTSHVAKSYDAYGNDFGGTRLVRRLETDFIRQSANNVSSKDIALDLGCANGYLVNILSSIGYGKVIGYDLSLDMIQEAKEKCHSSDKEEFKVVNLFEGIPLPNNSVDYVVANFGSASEIHPDIISEVGRVLKKGGRSFLSFYNTNSITSSWWQPIQSGLEPILSPKSNILEVPIFTKEEGAKVFKIYAKAYSIDDIISRVNMTQGLQVSKIGSFSPTLSVAPISFFDEKNRLKSMEHYEREHYYTGPYMGFYITAELVKH